MWASGIELEEDRRKADEEKASSTKRYIVRKAKEKKARARQGAA